MQLCRARDFIHTQIFAGRRAADLSLEEGDSMATMCVAFRLLDSRASLQEPKQAHLRRKLHVSADSGLADIKIPAALSCRYEAGGLLATDDSGVGVLAGSTLGGGTSIMTFLFTAWLHLTCTPRDL